MNAPLQAFCAVLASLYPLVLWARATDTRAWGEATVGRTRVRAVAAGALALQLMAAITAQGPAGGIALVMAGWMGLGWLLVLAMNQWPTPSLRAAQVLGTAGLCGCALGLAWRAAAA